MQVTAAGEFYRLNVPFELGLDVGSRLFRRGGAPASKRCLILDKERYRYRAALADVSGADIAAHNDELVTLVSEVRNWLTNEARLRNPPGLSQIWGAFNECMGHHYDELKRRGYRDDDVKLRPPAELLQFMQGMSWLF